MTSNSYRLHLLLVLILLSRLVVEAQSTATSTGSSSPPQPAEREEGGYVIHQSTEFGGRVSDVSGSQAMYDTLVDLRSGPRLLDQSLSMQSQAHDGLLFDNLFISSFGWGGEPNNGLHARINLDKWYDFRASFLRDQTDYNFDLLANPLNPPTSSPSIPANSSPHSFYTRRRMSNFDLTLLPQSVVSFRVGYTRNNMTGPSYSSVHEGTDALLYQPWNTTLNSYRFGADLKVLPHTVISYDQFLDYYKGDTQWQLNTFAPALLPGPPGSVELGLPINTGNSNPCGINAPATSLINPAGTLTNLACNSYFNYNRSDRVRTSTPTERISLQTSYFPRFELSASYAYSSADMNAPLDEFFNGLISRSGIRQETVTGPGHATRISNVADFSATVHLSAHFRVVDTFRYWAYRIPSNFSSTKTDWKLDGATVLTPISATTQSAATSPAQLSFNQSWTNNETDLIWDVSKRIGARIGFRYGDQIFDQFDYTIPEENRIVVHQYTPLVGFWAKPITGMRLNFDWENTSASNTIVRIGARKQSRYRIQASYTPRPWAVLAGSINLWQASNGNTLIDYRGHNRNYGFTATLTPQERFSVELAYNYTDYKQNAFICFSDSETSLPVVANAGSCETNGYNEPDTDNKLLTYGIYSNSTNYALGSLMFKPIPRVTTQVGYSITSVGGYTPQFNVLAPFGSLQYNYHQPLAKVEVNLGHNLTGIVGWNYYQYGEKSFVGPTDPRYFHANNETFSLRWAF